MVDYAREYGINVDRLMTEAFWHPAAQYDNARIHDRGVQFWDWYRKVNTEPPQSEPVKAEKVRQKRRVRQYTFTDAQLAIAMRSIRDAR